MAENIFCVCVCVCVWGGGYFNINIKTLQSCDKVEIMPWPFKSENLECLIFYSLSVEVTWIMKKKSIVPACLQSNLVIKLNIAS